MCFKTKKKEGEKKRRLYTKTDVLHHSVLLDVLILPGHGSAHDERREFKLRLLLLLNVSGILLPARSHHSQSLFFNVKKGVRTKENATFTH